MNFFLNFLTFRRYCDFITEVIETPFSVNVIDCEVVSNLANQRTTSDIIWVYQNYLLLDWLIFFDLSEMSNY